MTEDLQKSGAGSPILCLSSYRFANLKLRCLDNKVKRKLHEDQVVTGFPSARQRFSHGSARDCYRGQYRNADEEKKNNALHKDRLDTVQFGDVSGNVERNGVDRINTYTVPAFEAIRGHKSVYDG